jgi:cytochrome c553
MKHINFKGDIKVMSKKILLLLTILSCSVLFLAGTITAGTTVQDSFQIQSKEYSEHTYHPATLTHKKHATDYGAKCGDCHHDDKGKPLADLKDGDDVQRCIECHNKPGQKPKAKKGDPKLSPEQQREYHAEAMHDNCKGCHKDHNDDVKKKTGKKGSAPVSCTKCHEGGKIK